MHTIGKQKAEFFLNTIRHGGIHDLMQKEMFKLLTQDGYSTTDLKFYIAHGKWPSRQTKLDGIEEMVGEMVDDLETRRSKRLKRAIIVLASGIIFLFTYFGLLSLLGNDVSEKVPEPTQIEEPQNESTKL